MVRGPGISKPLPLASTERGREVVTMVRHLFVTRFRVEGEPEILAVTIGGIFISIGMNNAGISLAGNQLNSNDSDVGVPVCCWCVIYWLRPRSMMRSHPPFFLSSASSYNNIIASRDGRIVNAEGSATSVALSWSETGSGTLVHTNHYLTRPYSISSPNPASPRHVRFSLLTRSIMQPNTGGKSNLTSVRVSSATMCMPVERVQAQNKA